MKLYSARVRIGGSRDHEVDKHNLTAAEMKVLEALHVSPQGHPVIINPVHTGDVKRSDAKERARLAEMYSKGELVENRGEKIITGLFGVSGVPLPQEYEAPVAIEVQDFSVEEEEDEEIVPVAPPKRSDPKPARKSSVEEIVG
jgi:hypothetical protein